MMRGDHDAGTNGHFHRYSPSSHSPGHRTQRVPLVLWRLLGALDELTCVARETSYGYTLGLELAGEPIILELQPNVEALVDRASRLEAWLLTQGWTSAEAVID